MYISVKVLPQSRKKEIKRIGQGRFEVRVREKAERNLANKKMIEMLAHHFKVNVKEVKIINGHRHSSKLIKINRVNN